MSSRFRSLTPDDQRLKEDEISIDLEKFEAELNASIARLDGLPRPGTTPSAPVAADETPSEFPPLDLPPPRPLPAAPPPAPARIPGTQTGAGFDLLSELRQAAEEKAIAVQASESERKARVDRTEFAMRGLLRYLVEFAGHLNKLQPPLPHVFRPLPNLELSGLHWTESFIDYRTNGGTEISPLDSVSLRFTLSAGNSVRVEKLPHYAPAYLDELKRVGLRFTVNEKRGSRGLVEQFAFLIERAIVVSLHFKADPDRETIALQARNFAGLGNTGYHLKVARLDQEMLDELGKHVLGRPNRLFQLMTKE